jgi:TPR repeat protein
VLVIVVGIYFLAQCATSLEFSSLTRHDGTSPSERAEETDPSWADSCTFRPDYAPVCETAYPGKWYPKLAEQGKLRNAREQYELGKMYYEGKGVALDPVEAAKWYERAKSAS